MIKKIFVTLLILIFINFVFSCSVTSDQTVSKEELFLESGKIHAVILNNAEKITFNQNGGKLFSKKYLVEGITNKGYNKKFEIKIVSNLTWIDYSKNDSIISGKPLQFLKYLERFDRPDANKPFENITISEITTLSGGTYIFNENGARFYNQKNYVFGLTAELQTIEIEISEILYAIIEKTNAAGSILATMGVLVGAIVVMGIIAMATKESCPFVYSYDGENYVFDAEPLGGATTKGLERAELSKLEHLKPVNNKYKLLIKNEVPETQYLNTMSLLAVDHHPNTKVYSDLNCTVHVVKMPEKIITAEDEFGNDLTDFVKSEDDIFWQTHLPFDTTKIKDDYRHQLTCAFPKPLDIKSAKLIINAGTSLWGSQMIREMQSLYGNTIESWYEQMDRKGSELEQMLGFIEREELYIMKALIKEGDEWKQRASINGGGPFISETRSYDLDLRNVSGDTLFIKFNLPYGFWTLDYLAIDYSNTAPHLITEIDLSYAKDEYGNNLYSQLSNNDDQYHIMPNIGDYFLAEAKAPTLLKDYKRTIFLMTSGYYKLHLDKDKEIQSDALYKIITEPGAIVEYTLKCFNDWYSINSE